jgi:NADH-quinone oxidoreductase subunit J
MAVGPRVAFWLLTALVLGGALVTISRRNAVSAVMSLVATFFGLAGLYVMLSAQFLAAIQVLVYAGAIMTLFVFVVMVLNREESEPWALRGVLTKMLGLVALALMMGTSTFVFTNVEARVEPPPAGWGGVADIGEKLFTTWLFPFEAISLALLIAVIGAVVVARTPRHRTSAAASEGGEAQAGAAEHQPREGVAAGVGPEPAPPAATGAARGRR